MSIGKTVQWARMQTQKTQQELAESSGLAVSYLSRLENDRIAPTVRTLQKIAAALKVPLSSLFEPEQVLEAADHCPVSLSGRCILDQVFAGRGIDPHKVVESYSPQQLEALRLCNFLLHTQDKDLLRTLIVMLRSLLALSEARAREEKP
jgi:transcriptional regulator with XRE-family HTH domain